MKSLKFLTFLLTGSILLNACKKDDPIKQPVDDAFKAILVGSLTESRTFTENDTVILFGNVFVPENITLTFEQGTTIKSDITEKGALIIERGGKLICNGTQDKPVVFTSGKPVGERQPGDWGGIILLGKAPTNRATTPIIEGGVNKPYGGTDANDNSGSLKYVRIEYPGIAAQTGSEINGLTFGGVGAGTVIENVMVSYSNDDAFEFFGGTVNAKNLIAFATADDDYDFDLGYIGKIQYAISFRDPKEDDSDPGNGVESDNDGTGAAALPYTRPILSNFTWVGPNGAANTAPGHNFANRFRRGTRFAVYNSILLGYAKGGLVIDGETTGNAYRDGESQFKNNIVQAVMLPFAVIGSNNPFTDATLEAKAVSDGCIKYSLSTDIELTNITSLNAPNFSPKVNSPAKIGANYDGLDGFFTKGNFRGAIGDNDWTKTWTNFNPQVKVY
mgnify:CR=1 FL=1